MGSIHDITPFFFFIVFFLYLEIINWASVSLWTRDRFVWFDKLGFLVLLVGLSKTNAGFSVDLMVWRIVFSLLLTSVLKLSSCCWTSDDSWGRKVSSDCYNETRLTIFRAWSSALMLFFNFFWTEGEENCCIACLSRILAFWSCLLLFGRLLKWFSGKIAFTSGLAMALRFWDFRIVFCLDFIVICDFNRSGELAISWDRVVFEVVCDFVGVCGLTKFKWSRKTSGSVKVNFMVLMMR